MRTNKKYQLQHVVSSDTTRQAIGNIKFTGNQLFATNGIIAIIAETEPCENAAPSCLISPETWARAIKGAHKRSEFLEIDLAQEGAESKIGDMTVKNPTEESAGKYPDVISLWDRLTVPSEEGYTEISFDVTLLAKLAKGMGTETVTLRMRREWDPIEVTTSNDHKVKGLIMPVRTS
jgi:DNA polymerase III sliding clamp (beta) subunit (PCNA family)